MDPRSAGSAVGRDEAGALRPYALVAAAFLCLALVAAAAKGRIDFIVSDGQGYYLYLPSLVVDGDLDFRNQIEAHWAADPRPTQRTPTGLIADRYPIGMALTLLPSFLTAHLLAVAAYAVVPAVVVRPDGYSLPYQLLGLLTLLALGLATMVLLHGWLVRFLGFEERAARWAVVLFWVGSPYAYYYFREPFMVHVVSTFWVTAAVVLASGGAPWDERLRRTGWRGPLFALACTMAIVTRPTDVFVLLLVPALARAPGSGGGARYLIGLVPLLAQFAVWKALYGSWLAYTYGAEHFLWARPALLSTLLSPRHGLVPWSPLLAAALAGTWIGRRRWSARPARVMAALAAGFVLVWYLDSAWMTWWFGDAFGPRAFLELAPFFVAGLSVLVERVLRRGPGLRLAGACAASACVAWSWVLMALYVSHRISRSGPLF